MKLVKSLMSSTYQSLCINYYQIKTDLHTIKMFYDIFTVAIIKYFLVKSNQLLFNMFQLSLLNNFFQLNWTKSTSVKVSKKYVIDIEQVQNTVS